MTKKVIVASKNPVKVNATKIGFEKMFPNQVFEFVGVSVASGVSEQPLGDDETFLGAKNRADNAFVAVEGADFYVGIEGGVGQVNGEMEAFAWVFVRSADTYGKARTGTFFLPQKVTSLIKEGKELGEADDIVFKRNNSKQDNGAVGILTENVINRTTYYAEAVVLALIPFKNTDLY